MTHAATVTDRDASQFTEGFAERLVAHLNLMRRESQPDDPPVLPGNVWGQMQHLPATVDLRFWTVEDEAGIHAHARTQYMRGPDNQHLAHIELMVAPDRRGQGLGRQLLGHAARAMQAEGRTLLVGTTHDCVPAGERFARWHGFQPAQSTHINRLLLSDLPADLLDRWMARPDDGYTLEFWQDAVPEADLNAYASLLDVMNSAPTDDLDVEDSHITPEEVRALERLAAAGGRTSLIVAARAPDGTLAGMTDLSWRAAQPQIVTQGNTGVLDAHRGRGLGRWLKAANVQRLLTLNPQAREIRTQNADSNGPMLHINTELGFRPFMASTVWQGDTAGTLNHLKEH
ncbi:GNAT family N-acetyltransferase [Deinococcus fonticola]|uniref:GNAT family N-acetyltransferase n=1 Tax=Deinococcus fonticola TaxID=2528713 RepID=UPI0010756ED6|nr:GNAT family N-acetyltransferase [Deinococcus fonticola]